MTREEHRTWHEEHHDYLCRLIDDFQYHTKRFVVPRLYELRKWSFTQTMNPTETREEALDGTF